VLRFAQHDKFLKSFRNLDTSGSSGSADSADHAGRTGKPAKALPPPKAKPVETDN
jgi:hypothetical protein